ncbi:hypothetical protein HRR83_008413 [Exophiala dermatitidis]|uniref:Uncharacterized protein n=1 Tax=Exophiala dermatitidis TaxID=5970 RepID=A0AAN6ELM2_EXODE|nr:hypothetical protein HRR73_008228 [Exophiala dermatitidis]KAJ4506516.1 hypothetical protein HRR74_008414 [Exophiala dermatitidis]KAJ4533701.1 hypothetical protein HRR77_008453 [Exophiala dermatitidis]KAJ4547367.1 hypothetical protein HRR76_000017 [Exophiala dermatitidis]KAJ4560439.1 hypothetical protein HRR79_008117 [Exophiala dermatitidis]
MTSSDFKFQGVLSRLVGLDWLLSYRYQWTKDSLTSFIPPVTCEAIEAGPSSWFASIPPGSELSRSACSATLQTTLSHSDRGLFKLQLVASSPLNRTFTFPRSRVVQAGVLLPLRDGRGFGGFLDHLLLTDVGVNPGWVGELGA